LINQGEKNYYRYYSLLPVRFFTKFLYFIKEGKRMKRKLTYFAGSFVLATAFAFGVSYQPATAAQSCEGQCKRAFNGCVNSAKTQSERAQCNKSFQGCMSSCK
jgi:hypothetical protein